MFNVHFLESWEIDHTLSGKKMSGESDENFKGVPKFSPDEFFPRYFITRPKLLPDFFIPDQNFYPKFYTETKIQI